MRSPSPKALLLLILARTHLEAVMHCLVVSKVYGLAHSLKRCQAMKGREVGKSHNGTRAPAVYNSGLVGVASVYSFGTHVLGDWP